MAQLQSTAITGSLTASVGITAIGGFTGSITSASFALLATTASFALTSAGGGGGGGGGVFVTASDPTLTVNPTTTGSLWLNSSSGQLFVNSDRTANANEWLNLSTGSNIAIGNTFYSFVTASVQKIVSGATIPLLVQLKDRFNKSLNINTNQPVTITGSDGTYTSTVYSASGIFTSSVTGPNKVTGSFTVSGSISGSLLTPITFTIVEPQRLHALGVSAGTLGGQGISTSSGFNGHSNQLIGTGGPQQISALNTWESASTNGVNTLATTIDGRLYAWGEVGQLLGTGSFNSAGGSATPTLVGTGSLTSSVWVQHSIGFNHAAAIRSDGTLWAWGLNVSGALGLGATPSASIPTQVGTDNNWVAVSCGDGCTFALKSDTTLWATGHNSHGQLGVGDRTSRAILTRIAGDNWSPRIFAAPARTSYAIKTNGTMFAWGWRGFNGGSLVPDGTSQDQFSTLVVTTPTQESSGSTNWVTVIPSRGAANTYGSDAALVFNASYGVAGNRFYGWGLYTQDFLFNRVPMGSPTTASAHPVIDDFITSSANIYLVGRTIYEIDSTGSLNAWGNFSSSFNQTNYGRTLPTASTIAGLTTTPQNAQLNNGFITSSQTANYFWHTGSTKIRGAKYRVTSNYNWKTFARGTTQARSSLSNPSLLITCGKLSGSSFPSASGAPTNVSFKIFTGSSNNDLPRFAYIEFSSSLDDAEIQVSSSYPNATGSQFVTYIGPATTRAYISPPSYSINIRHDLRYIKNGIPSPTTASITANYCPGNGAVLAGSCNGSGQFVATTGNGACGFSINNLGCAYTSCSADYSVGETFSGPCSDIPYTGYCCGTYYDYYVRDPGATCYQFISRDVSACG